MNPLMSTALTWYGCHLKFQSLNTRASEGTSRLTVTPHVDHRLVRDKFSVKLNGAASAANDNQSGGRRGRESHSSKRRGRRKKRMNALGLAPLYFVKYKNYKVSAIYLSFLPLLFLHSLSPYMSEADWLLNLLNFYPCWTWWSPAGS